MKRDDEKNGCAGRPDRPETDRADLERGMQVAFPPKVDLSPATLDEADDDEWGGNVVPMPISAQEREGLRALGRAVRAPRGFADAIRRYGFYADACGCGVGMDPDLVAGLRAALGALVLLDGARPATCPDARRAKVGRLSRYQALAAGNFPAMLSAAFAEDRRRTCRGKERRS